MSITDCELLYVNMASAVVYTDARVVRYLALIAALAAEADFVFIPEWPPENFWEERLCSRLEMVIASVELQHMLLLHYPLTVSRTI